MIIKLLITVLRTNLNISHMSFKFLYTQFDYAKCYINLAKFLKFGVTFKNNIYCFKYWPLFNSTLPTGVPRGVHAPPRIG